MTDFVPCERNIAVGNAACPVPQTVLGCGRAEGVKLYRPV